MIEADGARFSARARERREVRIVRAILAPPAGQLPASIEPVEHAVAVDRYLAEATLSLASRRIYKISLTSWCWPLVGQRPPPGRSRRGAAPPVVPLALLEHGTAAARISAAVADRASAAGARTVNRELSALRGAIGWWQDQGWIRADPTAGLRQVTGQNAPLPALPALTDDRLAALWRSEASLREHALWHLLYDSAVPASDVLALDASDVDLRGGRTRAAAGSGPPIQWTAPTGDLLSWLLAGRGTGPVFLTGRRAPARAATRDRCPLTGRARLSYRRAAEIFTAHTSGLDPAGCGWTLHQLRSAGATRSKVVPSAGRITGG
jgi:integrase/recombinase XerD